jgi:two-component system chemotaxis sensor kinase CheA
MSDLDEFRATYFEECAELLTELEEQLAAIEGGERSSERLHAIFRAVHSIKGGGGAFGFGALVAFAHAYESLLDLVRDGRVRLSETIIALCLKGNDILADFVKAARTGTSLPKGHGAQEIAQFEALARGEDTHEPIEEFDIDFVPVMVNLDELPDAFDAPPLMGESGHWEIRFRPHAELYSRANDPLLLLRELASLGEIEVKALLEELPSLAEFEPFGVYCGWEITLRSSGATRATIEEVFEFVDGICDLSVVQLAAAMPPPEKMDEMPSFDELVAEFRPDPGPAKPAPEPVPAAPSPPAAVPVASPPQAQVVALEPPEDRRTGEPDRRSSVQSIRVDLDKVDRVVNMVGELVITQSMLTQQMDDTLRARYQELVRGLEVLAQTTRGLQDSVMAIRAQPVKSVFSRMPRLVRELAEKTGKKLKLEMVGEATEIDKTMIEQLADPLTHMIRNSADHGIELPEARVAAGKPEHGTIRIAAEQAGGNILITVEDDGAGIDRQRVLEVAIQRGVVEPGQVLSDEQIDQLIFAPGFSTARTISDISGRGVGMDVVLANIKKIGGSVHVRSWSGKGARITLRLPLTLAVLDVMLVKVAGNPYVIPLSSILETLQCARAEFGRQPSGARVLRVRGEYVQVIELAERFGMVSPVDEKSRFVVLCEADGNAVVGLVVDDIIGQQQVVIKSLEENFERIEGIAGGTILGDGNVALIIDPQGLRTTVGHKRAA